MLPIGDYELRAQVNRDNASTRSKQGQKRPRNNFKRDDRLLQQTTDTLSCISEKVAVNNSEIDSQLYISDKSTSNQGFDKNMSKKKREEHITRKPDEALTLEIVDSTSSSNEVPELDVEIRGIQSSDPTSSTSPEVCHKAQLYHEGCSTTREQEMKSPELQKPSGSTDPIQAQGNEFATDNHTELAPDSIPHSIGETDKLEQRIQFNRDNSSTKTKMNRRYEGRKAPVDPLRQKANDSLKHHQTEEQKTNEGMVNIQTSRMVNSALHEEINADAQLSVRHRQSDCDKIVLQEQVSIPLKNVTSEDLEKQREDKKQTFVDPLLQKTTESESSSHIQLTKMEKWEVSKNIIDNENSPDTHKLTDHSLEFNSYNPIETDDLTRRVQFNRDNASTKNKQKRREDARRVKLVISAEMNNSTNCSLDLVPPLAEEVASNDLPYIAPSATPTGDSFDHASISDNFLPEIKLQSSEDDPKAESLDTLTKERIKPATEAKTQTIDSSVAKLNAQPRVPSSHNKKPTENLDRSIQLNRDNSSTRNKQSHRTESRGMLQTELTMPTPTISTTSHQCSIEEADECVETDEAVSNTPRSITPNHELNYRAPFNRENSATRANQKLREKDNVVMPKDPAMSTLTQPMSSPQVLIQTLYPEKVKNSSLCSNPNFNLSQHEYERRAQVNRDNSTTKAKQAQHGDNRKAKNKVFGQSHEANFVNHTQTQQRMSEPQSSLSSVLSVQQNALPTGYQKNRTQDHPGKLNILRSAGSTRSDSYDKRADRQTCGRIPPTSYNNTSTGGVNEARFYRNSSLTQNQTGLRDDPNSSTSSQARLQQLNIDKRYKETPKSTPRCYPERGDFLHQGDFEIVTHTQVQDMYSEIRVLEPNKNKSKGLFGRLLSFFSSKD